MDQEIIKNMRVHYCKGKIIESLLKLLMLTLKWTKLQSHCVTEISKAWSNISISGMLQDVQKGCALRNKHY